MTENPFKVGDKIRQKPREDLVGLFVAGYPGYSNFLDKEVWTVVKVDPKYVFLDQDTTNFGGWVFGRFELVESAPIALEESIATHDEKIVWVLYDPSRKNIDAAYSTRSVARERKRIGQRVKKAKIVILEE